MSWTQVSKVLAIVACMGAVGGCGKPNGQRFTTVIVDSGEAGAYAAREAVMEDVENLGTLQGKVVEFYAAPKFNVNFTQSGADCFVNGAARCDDDPKTLRSAVTPKDVERVTTRFATDGKLVRALDFDTFNMATAYVLLNEADAFCRRFGWDPLPFGRSPVWYFPQAQGLLNLSFPRSDNAAYFQYIDGFILFPMRFVDGVPLGMNRGVMFHEYHHRVFANRVYGGNIFKTLDLLSSDTAGVLGINRIKAVDEGAADFFGAIGAKDAKFLSHSIAGVVSDERDLSIPRTFDTQWIDGSKPSASTALADVYDPYIPGSVFAHTLWRLRELLGEEPVVRAWFATEDALRVDLQEDATRFAFDKVLNFLAQQFEGADRTTACTEIAEHFSVLMQGVTTCSP